MRVRRVPWAITLNAIYVKAIYVNFSFFFSAIKKRDNAADTMRRAQLSIYDADAIADEIVYLIRCHRDR